MILHMLLRGYQAWERREAIGRKLLHLTVRELQDIGMSRSGIERVVSQEIAELSR